MMDKVILEIINAEIKAKEFSANVKEKELKAAELISNEVQEFKKNQLDKAKVRVQRVKTDEEKFIAEKKIEISLESENNIKLLENIYTANKEKWIDELFTKMFGGV